MRKLYCFILVVVMSVCVMACGKKDDVVQTDDTQIQTSEVGDAVVQEEQTEQEEDELEVILGVDGDVLATDIPESSTEEEKNTPSSESNGSTDKQEVSTDKSQDTQYSGSNESAGKKESSTDKSQNTQSSGSNGATGKQESSSENTSSSETNESTEGQEESTEDQGIIIDEPIELPFVPAT